MSSRKQKKKAAAAAKKAAAAGGQSPAPAAAASPATAEATESNEPETVEPENVVLADTQDVRDCFVASSSKLSRVYLDPRCARYS